MILGSPGYILIPPMNDENLPPIPPPPPPVPGELSPRLPGVPDTPETRRIVRDFTEAGNRESIEAVIQGQKPGLERYGLKLRKVSLMECMILWELIGDEGNAISEKLQPFVWIWSLAAPLEKVYEGIELRKKSLPAFLAAVHEWFGACGIPQEFSQEILDSVAETFRMITALMPKGKGEADDPTKKKLSHGSS